MILTALLEEWSREPVFRELVEQAASQPRYRAVVTGLDSSARTFLQAGLAAHCRRPTLIITSDAARAEKIFEDLLAFFPSHQVNLLPARELFMDTDVLTQSVEQRQQRLFFLEWLEQGAAGIFVAPIAALISRALPPEAWRGLVLRLRTGRQIDRETLLQQLIELGYERVPLIEGKGQCSARGEIIDLFPFGREQPVRVELFNDTIESIRYFDPHTQRSTERLNEVSILPAYELPLPSSAYSMGACHLRREMEQAAARLLKKGERESAAKLKTRVEHHLNRLAEPGGLDMLAGYFSYFYGTSASLLDYLPADSLILADEPAAFLEQETTLRRELSEHRSNFFLQGELLPGQLEPLLKASELLSRAPAPLISCSLFTHSTGGLDLGLELRLEAKGVSAYHGQWELLKDDIFSWLKADYKVCLLTGSPERGAGLLKTLQDSDIPVTGSLNRAWAAHPDNPVQMVTATLEEGFILPAMKLAVITEHNLVPRRRKRKRLARREGVRLRDYRELNTGDYVVHEQHGIGKYLGLSTLEIGGIQRDYLLVKYSGTDKLYIPVEQIELIQKYIGAGGKAPRLHSLGSGEWHRIKSKVNASVQEMAQELLSMYAARQATPGLQFGADHPWQLEFEARFPYEETADQLQSIAEVKADMEKPQPMDRLICGDVGYGKTEVALRAAFKSAMEGKQVALLVPTTILAQQHFRTFQERFADFPLQVAQLSRFVPPARQKEVLTELAAGKVDIIIGTHRLLSKDVRFHDLGLLIIDEEQRFGVRHKERLKQLRLEVDVLAMTATPIPRTLHLSLVGARDFSVIETPPEDRYPVQTFVVEYAEQMVKEAILRELNRQGQVYFVFNRVEGISAMAKRLQELLPGVPIAVGHGQMSEIALEQVMSDFMDGKYKILISTTIIEAGLDIPNVNTLIVYEADHFGLAQLYQLRGRVGRSNRVAYAYLTYRREKIVSETAQKRLQAIKEFTELGSGFKVALRDLEIRGAGNILGAEQHGFMVAVGFDLYCRLMEQAVAEIKNIKPVQQPPAPRLELSLSAYLPASYIANQEQKIDIYQRLYALSSAEELSEVEEELRDRYGKPPAAAKNLLGVTALRLLAQELGIELIQQQRGIVVVKFGPAVAMEPADLWPALSPFRGKVSLAAGKTLSLKVKVEGEPDQLIIRLVNLLQEILSYVREKKQVLPRINRKGGE